MSALSETCMFRSRDEGGFKTRGKGERVFFQRAGRAAGRMEHRAGNRAERAKTARESVL